MANTPFLDLVKPAGTDKALVSVINSNSDKIDGGVSTLSDQIAKLNSDENTTTDILASALAATRTTFFKGSGSGYTGNIPAQSALNYGSFIVNVRNTYRYVIGVNTEGKVFTNVYGGSSWYGWKQLAINEELGGTKFLTFNVNNSSVTIDLSNGFRGVLFSSSAYSSEEGIYSVRTSSAGGVSMGTFFASSGLTFNTSENNKLTISSTRYVEFTLTIMNGTASK